MGLMVNVSIVVSTYSEDKLDSVLDCVKSLMKQSVLPYEVFLVVDPRPSLAEFFENKLPDDVRVVMSSGFGLSNARNAGVKVARGDVVAFIDDDAVADGNWLRNLVQSYDDPEVLGVGGYARPVWEGGSPKWFPEELNWIVGCSYKGLPEQRSLIRNPIGCNMSFRRSVFDAVGYFRTDVGRFGKILLAGEEPELSMRISLKFPNSRIIYDPSAVVYHSVPRGRRKLTYFFRRSFYQGISIALFMPRDTTARTSLSTENDYLKYLLEVAVPSKIMKAYRLENLSHLMIMALSTLAVFLGFSAGKLRHSLGNS
jgi:glucosyl-dolichyl phosphate glucuronosyltransferase